MRGRSRWPHACIRWFAQQLRKIEQAGLLRKRKAPETREVAYDITEEGKRITDAFARMRAQLLAPICASYVESVPTTQAAAIALERFIGLYDLATQHILHQNLIAVHSALAPPVAAPATTQHGLGTNKRHRKVRPT